MYEPLGWAFKWRMPLDRVNHYNDEDNFRKKLRKELLSNFNDTEDNFREYLPDLVNYQNPLRQSFITTSSESTIEYYSDGTTG